MNASDTAIRDLATEGRLLGSARTPIEKRVEDALLTVERWHDLHLAYAPVSGGLQNSNWRISVEGDERRYFLKIPGAGSEEFIDRSLANEAARRSGDLGVSPEVVVFDEASGVEIIEFLEDYRACTNGDFKNLAIPHAIMDVYRTLHGGSLLSVTKTIFDMIEEHLDQARRLGVQLPSHTEGLLREYDSVKAAMTASGFDLVACHNDPMPGNFLICDGKPLKVVDFEFASNNERSYELAVLLTEMFYEERQVLELIEAYYGRVDWAIQSRVQVSGALADLKWGLWGCVNQQLNETWDFDYYKYGAWKLMRSRLKMSDPRWALWVASL